MAARPTGDSEAAPPVVVRRASMDDLDPVTDLYVQLKRHHSNLATDNPRYLVSDERWHAVAKAALSEPETAVFVAETGERILGIITLSLRAKPWGLSCEIDTLVVDESIRRRGLGRRLLAQAESYARTHGAAGMRVDVLDTNLDARDFYERAGYSIYAVRFGKATGLGSEPDRT